MSWEFFTHRKVRAAKIHTCEQCRGSIEAGSHSWYCAGKYDGEFYCYREHIECRDAWNELNFDVRDYPLCDGAPFLCDDDLEADDRAWMREKHPVVAGRLGWGAAQ